MSEAREQDAGVIEEAPGSIVAPPRPQPRQEEAPGKIGEPNVAAPPSKPSQAQEPSKEKEKHEQLPELSLEELSQIEVGIASKVPLTAAQAPSIVTVITRQEIETYGARDAVDILRMVPGFEFGMDANSVLGAGMRGIWVHEGKMLLMINGVSYNDYGFGNENFFGSIPASMISRVEIIRGPGSAVYGRFAEVCTVNFITHPGAKLNGALINGSVGTFGSGEYTRSGNISLGGQFSDLELSATVGYTGDPLSRRVYHDFFGGTLQMGEPNSLRQWRHVIIEARLKGLSFGYARSSFTFLGQDAYITIFPKVNGLNAELLTYVSDTVNARYQQELFERFFIDINAQLAQGYDIGAALRPASIGLGRFAGTGMNMQRVQAEVSARYDFRHAGRATLGLGYLRDNLLNVSRENEPGLQLSPDPTNLAFFVFTDSKYAFGEYTQQFGPFGVTGGARYENTTFGNAFAPRVGLTFVKNKLNAKLLYGRAFRIPLPWQVYSRLLTFPGGAGGVTPETSNTVDGEIGYRFSNSISAKINGFFIDIHNPIVYISANNSYQNFGRIQSYGVEAEIQARYAQGGGFMNFSTARPGTGTSPGFVSPTKNYFLAMPPYKLTVGANYLWRRIRVAPSMTLLSKRYAQDSSFAHNLLNDIKYSNYSYQSYPALALFNLTISMVEPLPGLTVSLNGYNLFNAPYVLLQPYYGGHAPLPVGDREIALSAQLKI